MGYQATVRVCIPDVLSLFFKYQTYDYLSGEAFLAVPVVEKNVYTAVGISFYSSGAAMEVVPLKTNHISGR